MHPSCRCVHGRRRVGILVVNGCEESSVANIGAFFALIRFLRCQLQWTWKERCNWGRRFENVLVDTRCCRVEVLCEGEVKGIVAVEL